MKFSTKSQYGLRAVLNLAEHTNQEPKPLSQISDEEEIPYAYLEQIFSLLKKNKIVKGVRGAAGGYRLGSKPNKITIKKLFNTLEGPLVSLSCVQGNKPCRKEQDCKAKRVWKQIDNSLNQALSNLTLADLINNHE
jgi:Rrf2 family protein